MTDDIGDVERSCRIDVDDDAYAHDISIERVFKISRRIWSEKLRMLIAEFIDESFCSTIDEFCLIEFLTSEIVLLEEVVDIFEEIIIICL